MTTIEVPGDFPRAITPTGLLTGLGVGWVALVAALAWFAASSGQRPLWVVPIGAGLVTGTFIASITLNHIGRGGRIQIRQLGNRWSVLGSQTGQRLLVGASAIALGLAVWAIFALPERETSVWLVGMVSVFALIGGGRRLYNPVGWRFDENAVTAVSSNQKVSAVSWKDMDGVELSRQAVAVFGKGQTAAILSGDIASDPAVVATMFEFYRVNRRSRSELSDDRVLERLRSGNL